jgi:hypothetical protein
VRDEQDSEVEVKLFHTTIRRRVKREDRRALKADAATGEHEKFDPRRSKSAMFGGPLSIWRLIRRLLQRREQT